MSVPLFAATDSVSAVLGFALDGLSLRQRTIADNISNVNTPEFRAQYVDFESVLRAAIGQAGGPGETLAGRLAATTPEVGATRTPVQANGNSVDLRKETLAAVQSQYQYQMIARAVTDRFQLLSTAAGA